MDNNPGALIYTNTNVQKVLNQESIACTIFEEGEKIVESLRVRAIPAAHQPLLAPVPQNTAFLVNELFLTAGDSINQSLHAFSGTQVLALPILAPWANVRPVATFLEAMKPATAIPAHDGFVIDQFRDRQHRAWESYAKERSISFESLNGPEKSFEF